MLLSQSGSSLHAAKHVYRTKGQQSKAEQALFFIKKHVFFNIFQISRSGAFFSNSVSTC